MADEKISDLTELTVLDDLDELVVVDKSDTTMALTGTNKKIKSQYLKGKDGIAVYTELMPTPTVAGQAWVDPSDGRLYIAVPDAGSTLVWVQTAVISTEKDRGPRGFTGDPGIAFRYIGDTEPDTSDWDVDDFWYDTSTE